MSLGVLAGGFCLADLQLDEAAEADRIAHDVRGQILHRLRRKGAVVGLSGGIDSSVTAGICAQALGSDRVLGLLMPERDSCPDSLRLGQLAAQHFGIPTMVEDITGTLQAAGCYRRRDAALRETFPEYQPGWRWKIVLPSLFDGPGYRVFSAVIESPEGIRLRRRLPLEVYQEIVAATNFKQRARKMMEYYHADRLRYAVAGTPNLLEYDLGFFVKNGDGAADVKPIAHLYKTQVYQLADYLGVPEEIRRRPPTTDTFSLAQTQEEFFFSLPYEEMDACLYGKNHDIPCEDVARAIGRPAGQVARVYQDIDAKRRAARYLHEKPLLATQPTPGKAGYL